MAAAAEAAPAVSPPRGITTVPDDFVVDATARYTGTVAFYSKLKGYGFVEVAQKGVVPDDRVFVHWRNIESEDRFPFLVKDMEVEFGLTKWKEMAHRGKVSLRATAISAPGGSKVNLQNDIDKEKKSFIGGQDKRFTGSLKFYNPRFGYGSISVDPNNAVEGQTLPTELWVERSEVNAGGEQPPWMENLAVEFGIWKTSRDVPKAYNVTLPGGLALTKAALENRQAVGAQTYCGTVQLWNWRQGWGFIKSDPSVPLPPNAQAKLTQQMQEAAARAVARGQKSSEDELLYVRRSDVVAGVKLEKGMQVMFHIYMDDKGVGACDVQIV